MTVAALPPAYRELYEERAAIREYDGNQARPVAELRALNEIWNLWVAEKLAGNERS